MNGSKLPNLICPGAPKAGTTTLYNLFAMHPDIYVSDFKELYYFSNDRFFNKGSEWYARNFKDYSGEKYIADITPFYLASEESPGRIRRLLGEDVKFIIMLRNPIDRAYSQFLMQSREEAGYRSFRDMVFKKEKNADEKSILSNGYYFRNLTNYLDYYPKESFHFVLMEDLVSDFGKVAEGIFCFLGISNMELNMEISSNSRFRPKRKLLFRLIKKIPNRVKVRIRKFFRISTNENITRKLVGYGNSEQRDIDGETYKTLQDIYANDIEELEKLIERDLSPWLKN